MWNMELCISISCRLCHRAQLFLIMLQKPQQVWVCRLQAFDMKCRGALESRSGNIDLQELLIYRNKKHYRKISYSGGIHPQIWLLLSTHVSDFSGEQLWGSAPPIFLNPKISLHTGETQPSAPVRVLGRSQCFALLLSPLPVPQSVTALSPGSCPFSLTLPFIKSPSYGFPPKLHHTPLIYSCFVFTRSFGLPLSFTVPPQEWWHRKGQLTDLRTPEYPVSRGLDLICINLHNFIKAQGDAVHTVAWDTSERNSPLRMAVIMGLSLLTTVGDWNSEKFHAAWPNPQLFRRRLEISVRWP